MERESAHSHEIEEKEIEIVAKINQALDRGSIEYSDFSVWEEFIANYAQKYPQLEQRCVELVRIQLREEISSIDISQPQIIETSFYLEKAFRSISDERFYFWTEALCSEPAYVELKRKRVIEYISTASNYETILDSLKLVQDVFSFEGIGHDQEVKGEINGLVERLIEHGAIAAAYETATNYFFGGGYTSELHEQGKTEKSEHQIIEQRIELARTLAFFESIVAKASTADDIVDFFDLPKAKDIPFDLVKKMKEIAARYFEQRKETQAIIEALSHELNKDNGNVTQSELGAHIFAKKTGAVAKGMVEAKIEEGYIILICSSSEDYRQFAGKKQANSEGLYHRASGMPLDGKKAKLMLIRGTDPDILPKTIVIHERQHFINDMIDFADIEKQYFFNREQVRKKGLGNSRSKASDFESASSLRSTEYALKDEFLAYIREGASLGRIDDTLREDGEYQNLYPYNNDERANLVSCLKKTIQLLDTREMRTLLHPAERAILVYLLIDVPFSFFPSFLEKVRNHQTELLRQQKELEGKQRQTRHHQYLLDVGTARTKTLIDAFEQGEVN